MGTRTGSDQKARVDVFGAPAKSVLREYAEIILICLLFLIFSRTFVVQQSEIPSGSMEDTLLIGDYILVNRFLYAPTSFDWERRLLPIRDVERGDVLVFKKPNTPEVDFIKRVIAGPGDTVEMRRGYVFVNGVRADEDAFVGKLYREPESFAPRQIPPGQYFVMGDHRNASLDSRRWGTVPRELIKGRAFMVLFSTSAPPAVGEEPGEVTFWSLFRKVYNLLFRSRWDRSFTAIR